METETKSLVKAGIIHQMCRRFAMLGSDSANWPTIRGEIARDFRGYSDVVYDELIKIASDCSFAAQCCNDQSPTKRDSHLMLINIPLVKD